MIVVTSSFSKSSVLNFFRLPDLKTKSAFWNSLGSVEKLCFGNRLVWTVDLSLKPCIPLARGNFELTNKDSRR